MTERDGAERRAELARVRAALAGASGRQRLELLLGGEDPRALVRALPADELWFTIREVGLADAAEVVQLASPEQFKVFLDLEAWQGATPDPRRALPWLRAARGRGLADDDATQRRWRAKLHALDVELLDLVLLDTLRIHDLDQDPDPELEGDRFMRTPENRYVVEFTVDGADYAAVRGLLDDLYAEDPFRATRVLSAVRSELRSELEETALRWRTGRLADLGHPPLDEALSWFARPAASPAARPGRPARPAGFWLAPPAAGSLLARAAAALPAAAAERFQAELVLAANAVLVAEQVDLGDLDAVRAALEAARTLVELGLEERARGGDAAAALAATPVKILFQEGFGRTLARKHRAERLLAADPAARRLDAPLAEGLLALARRRPRFLPTLALGEDAWGTPEAAAVLPRPFLSAADLAAADRALDAAERLLALARELGLAPAAAPPALRLSALYLTALAHERLGRPFAPAPLAAAEVPAAARALRPLDDPRLAARGEAGALLATLVRNAAEELAPLAGGVDDLPPGVQPQSLWVKS